ncbi:hypothetical protein CCACVL1_04866 [Corchorus capsularis]|uniref:3'-5' exonuclease n=1 Tax=Corchorus capsularis TaxID=210143 RepID=A0A1R3JP89_COCAP|nr:hypothetical protein CCACVL1_04866 [Corchorus capsularis]
MKRVGNNLLKRSKLAADSKLRHPPLRYGGEILYSRTTDEVEKAAGQLLKMVEIKKKEMGHVAVPVGFDIEWKPTFQRGASPGKAAVMQICLDTNYCYVMHIFHSGIPPSLRFLLEDSTIIKYPQVVLMNQQVGVAIGGDASKVFTDYNVSVKALEDLRYLANQKLNRDSYSIALNVRLNISLGKYIKFSVLLLLKPKKIMVGNWELYPLSKEQLQYAATDAFASWHLHQFNSLPSPKSIRHCHLAIFNGRSLKMQSEENNKLDWDQNFTEQVIQSMDAIEASLQPSSSSPSPSSIVKKRKFTEEPKTRRRLPDSIVSQRSSPPFSLSRCRDSKLRYPPLRFGGEILYSRTTDEVEKAARQLLKILEIKKKEMGQVAVGFDIEWKPTFRRGALPSKAAVMQICFDTNYCYVMHIFHSGIPPSLRFLLEDSTIIKVVLTNEQVGVAIGGDAVKVFSDYNVSVKAVEDLSDLANQKLNRDHRHWGLASLTETLVCKEVFIKFSTLKA